ncbi:helicase-related protein [Sinanaerobacter sp. ZZT-01]|nr:helicase-related protein [Sinanaerobacter sp. ZZT-01]WRR95121.1 helicase-related protein [Sinanaerobacter sp. ZZT-01]
MVDQVLLSGGGREKSRLRIFAKYQKGKSEQENITFLKNEYEIGGKGFILDGQSISVWYDEKGMRFSHGHAARFEAMRMLSWEEIEKRVHNLILSGSYMTKGEMAQVEGYEKKSLASKIYSFFRDERNEMPEELGINHIYPKSEEKIIRLLSHEKGIDSILVCMDRAINELESGKVKARFRLIYKPRDIRSDVEDLKLIPKKFPSAETTKIPIETFITQDEIDYRLCGGSNFSESTYRIYDYFSHELKDNNEAATFLKKEYGTGGSAPALPGSDDSYEDHDYKGLKLKKGSIFEPNAEILLTWKKVAERVHKLIKTDRYLSAEEMTDYLKWKEEKELPSTNQAVDVIVDETNLSADSEEEKEPLESALDNFQIKDEQLGYGGAKEKFQRNIVAIETLKQIESENRKATSEEQNLLSQYVGWGGLSQAFDESNAAWSKEYLKLKELLSEGEFSSARESTLNSHYTSPVIIDAMHAALEQMGFENGKILEPSMGIGNFFGMLPSRMQESSLYGVELDNLTGRIAKQLYPNAKIEISGFEDVQYPDNYFDLVIGNVPFGQYKVSDKTYDKYNFLIHDYFFAKSLDKVRDGGVVAFITSSGTMDKQNPSVRRYLSQKAELLGAIRLPDTAFKANAGTEVMADILFFKKEERKDELEPPWVQLSQTDDGFTMNQYFVQHPEMILGKMTMESGPFGEVLTCKAITEIDLKEQLTNAVKQLQLPKIYAPLREEKRNEETFEKEILPADASVRNFSYTLVDDTLYFRENAQMLPIEVSIDAEQRIRTMISLRDITRKLIEVQLNDGKDEEIHSLQRQLNQTYDTFIQEYGLINHRANKKAFIQDSSYCLLCSLEILDESGDLERKADMFTKRTIKREAAIKSVSTATEALAISIGERACVDLGYMSQLMGGSEKIEEIKKQLEGIIFKNPESGEDPLSGWEAADEYLSGNVREKLAIAREAVNKDPSFSINVSSLEQVQPKDLSASEIDVRLGATWVDTEYYNQFMYELLQTPRYLRNKTIAVRYAPITGEFNVSGKMSDSGNNTLANVTYGTKRRNAYSIIEDSLNLRDVRIFDAILDADGKEKRVLNSKETILAQQKQDSIREAFKSWVWDDPERREVLSKKYNELFNSIRPREYDGQHIQFVGMNPEITLLPHQRNAVAHILYGQNVLLAHCVGAGKTFEMIAASMEAKRLGLCQKSLYVVPNHLTEQWGADTLRLYPGANIIVARKEDFQPENRKKFCARIATGEYDAVIIGHSQFEKIPLSAERQKALIQQEIDEIVQAIKETKDADGERYTIKQMEKSKKNLMVKLKKLNDESKKDDVVTFEELGVDRLFIDEAHAFKNLFLHTKMRNIAGIGQSQAQKSSDMFAKCCYMDELTGGKGVTFATGTPVSNSMVELYTMMRYLQYDTLQKQGLGHFDSWAANFGETVTAIELAPEGTGFRAKTRFAKFFNLPELMAMWKEAADIQTADMLKLPVPKAEYVTAVTQPSIYQKQMVMELSKRADAVRKGLVEPYVDNMLKITSDGRKLALDQRLKDNTLSDDPDSKVNLCVKNVFKTWLDTEEKKGTQLIFCDLSTPKKDGSFNVYDDIRTKLINKGVPEEEIAFIHDANTEIKKAELFAKVRKGKVRVLLGSTSKMGAGTNIQDRLAALHHIDCPWRPADIEQREGRILRKGNQNECVKIFKYVTEATFDAYNWGLIENKQKFIGQIMTSKSPARSCEDIDETALSYAEVKALATGDPLIKEKMDLDITVSKLMLLKSNYLSQRYRLEDDIVKNYPIQIQRVKLKIETLEKDIKTLHSFGDQFEMTIGNNITDDKSAAGQYILDCCNELKNRELQSIGQYKGLEMLVSMEGSFFVQLKGSNQYKIELGHDAFGVITRINNKLDALPMILEESKQQLENLQTQMTNAKKELAKPFFYENELIEKEKRMNELNTALNLDKEEEEVKKEDCKFIGKKESFEMKL